MQVKDDFCRSSPCMWLSCVLKMKFFLSFWVVNLQKVNLSGLGKKQVVYDRMGLSASFITQNTQGYLTTTVIQQ